MKRNMQPLAIFALLCLVWSVQARGQQDPVDRLKNEPVTLFDLAMFRLQNDFFIGRDYDANWFQREYKGIEFSLDMAIFWPSRRLVMIHRDLKAKATLANCTIAVETLRNDLTSVIGVDGFIKKYFWHYDKEAPDWLREIGKAIVLVGEVYDPAASAGTSPFFYCESGLTEAEVRIVKERRVYR